MKLEFIAKPLRQLQTFVSCRWGALCSNKIKWIEVEKARIKENLKWYPPGSLEYDRLKLGIAICKLKIELFKALGGVESN